MQIRITKTFSDPASPRPFIKDERLDVPDAIATRWISEGCARSLSPAGAITPISAVPPKSRRERASR